MVDVTITSSHCCLKRGKKEEEEGNTHNRKIGCTDNNGYAGKKCPSNSVGVLKRRRVSKGEMSEGVVNLNRHVRLDVRSFIFLNIFFYCF